MFFRAKREYIDEEDTGDFQPIPDEILNEIFLFLDLPSIPNICLTSKRMKKVVDNDIFWKLYCKQVIKIKKGRNLKGAELYLEVLKSWKRVYAFFLFCLNQVEEKDDNTIPFKCVLLGESGVGKSSIVLSRGQFFEYQESTIGAAFLTQIVPLSDGVSVKLDTAGLERYPMYYRGAACVIVVYDVTEKSTLKKAEKWLKEVSRQGAPDAKGTLVGCKIDLADRREVNYAEGESLADRFGYDFFEASAKTAHNINELFVSLVKRLNIEMPKKISRQISGEVEVYEVDKKMLDKFYLLEKSLKSKKKRGIRSLTEKKCIIS